MIRSCHLVSRLTSLPTKALPTLASLGQPQPLLRFLTTSHSTELLKYQCLADRYYGIMVRGQTNPSLHSKIGTFSMCLYRVIGFWSWCLKTSTLFWKRGSDSPKQRLAHVCISNKYTCRGWSKYLRYSHLSYLLLSAMNFHVITYWLQIPSLWSSVAIIIKNSDSYGNWTCSSIFTLCLHVGLICVLCEK